MLAVGEVRGLPRLIVRPSSLPHGKRAGAGKRKEGERFHAGEGWWVGAKGRAGVTY